jgi:hypothetical protein
VTTDEVAELLEQYRAGIDAELTLLHQLVDVSHRQREVSQAADFTAFADASDARDDIMRSLVTIEDDVRQVRDILVRHREQVRQMPGYADVARRQEEAAHLVNLILSTDQQSMSALADAEVARRSAVVSLERGETTLAAYRRVLTPPATSATLVDKLG